MFVKYLVFLIFFGEFSICTEAAAPPYLPTPTFTSNWTEMDVNSRPFAAIQHGIGKHPVIVKVYLKVDIYGRNVLFEAMTSAQRDVPSKSKFGGAVYAYDTEFVYVWLPRETRNRTENAFCVGDPQYTFESQNAETKCSKKVFVQATVWGPLYFPEADYDSRWRPIAMSDEKRSVASLGPNTFIEVYHAFGVHPDLVSVQIRSKDNGTEFYQRQIYVDADGATYVERDGDVYGGVIYAYSNMSVRVWAPSPIIKQVKGGGNRIIPKGFLFIVDAGWGNGTLFGNITKGQVRIRAWRRIPGSGPIKTKTFGADKVSGDHDYRFHIHPIQRDTLVDVKIRALSQNNTGFDFTPIGGGQAQSASRGLRFGGLVVGRYNQFNLTFLMIFRPRYTTNGSAISVGPYYGNGVHNQHSNEYNVTVRVWQMYPPPACPVNNGGCHQVCEDFLGYRNCSCALGYELVLPQRVNCSDIDECARNISRCQHYCHNTQGSYRCSCRPGFKLNRDRFSCSDIDECRIAKRAMRHRHMGRRKQHKDHCQQECRNLHGSFECSCRAGFVIENIFKCRDVDECQTNVSRCHQNCQNTLGSYTCWCRQGFKLNPDGVSCDDVDECRLWNEIQPERRRKRRQDGEQWFKPMPRCQHICHNIHGSYECSCNAGFVLRDLYQCHDIDECVTNASRCHHNCHNTHGSYRCSCRPGFKLQENQLFCDDLNECDVFRNGCDHNCHNTHGSYTCSCRNGFQLQADGRSCTVEPTQVASDKSTRAVLTTGTSPSSRTSVSPTTATPRSQAVKRGHTTATTPCASTNAGWPAVWVYSLASATSVLLFLLLAILVAYVCDRNKKRIEDDSDEGYYAMTDKPEPTKSAWDAIKF